MALGKHLTRKALVFGVGVFPGSRDFLLIREILATEFVLSSTHH